VSGGGHRDDASSHDDLALALQGRAACRKPTCDPVQASAFLHLARQSNLPPNARVLRQLIPSSARDDPGEGDGPRNSQAKMPRGNQAHVHHRGYQQRLGGGFIIVGTLMDAGLMDLV